MDPFGNAFGHPAGGIPHGVINQGHLVFLVILGPCLVGPDDLQGILRQMTPWLGQIMDTGTSILRISAIFRVTMGLYRFRMLA